MKQIVKTLFRHAGLVVATNRHQGARYIHHPPRSLFELLLLRNFPILDDLTFIQIGANDGRRFDPIHDYVEQYRWRGVLVEPVPFIFRQLQQTYAGNPRLQLVEAAVDVQAGSREIHTFSADVLASLPEWAWGLASFNRSQLVQTAQALKLDERHLHSQSVPTILWSDLWSRIPGNSCDVLIVDTEGYDITLLRAAGLREHRPKLVHFEHMHTPRPERVAFYSELLEAGYQFATDEIDTTAWLTQPVGQ